MTPSVLPASGLTNQQLRRMLSINEATGPDSETTLPLLWRYDWDITLAVGHVFTRRTHGDKHQEKQGELQHVSPVPIVSSDDLVELPPTLTRRTRGDIIARPMQQGQDDALPLVDVPEHPLILRVHNPITTWDLTTFTHQVNPASRNRRFGHLKGAALAHALQPLPAWEQLHELNFYYNDFDVLLLYLIDAERVDMTMNKHKPMPLSEELEVHGFVYSQDRAKSGHSSSNVFQNKAKHLRNHLHTTLGILATRKPEPQPGLVPPGHMVIRIPGHFDEQFTLVNRPFTDGRPRGVNTKHYPTMCATARLQLPYDAPTLSRLVTTWSARLRLLDHTLLPWEPGQKMTDADPQVLTDDQNPIRKCFPAFWVKGFMKTNLKDTLYKKNIDTYCTVHKCMEIVEIKVVFLAQWACGFFSPEQLIALLYETSREIYDNQHHRISQGSHGCLKRPKVSYEGIFCVRWELAKDNLERRPCQTPARDEDYPECICPPGKTLPCFKHSGNITAASSKEKVAKWLSDNQHLLNACSYPSCDFHVNHAETFEENLLSPRVNAFVRYFNAEHGGKHVEL